jgi:hypothetical protein
MKQILISTEERLSKNIVDEILIFLGIKNFSDNVKIQTVKSEWDSSFVDVILEVVVDGVITKGFLIEITQSTDKDSRNSSSYQRLQKFIIGGYYYPTYQKILYHTEIFQATTDTSKIGLSLAYLSGIEIVNVSGEFPKTIEDLENLKNSMNGPSHNTPLKFWYDKEQKTLTISSKLNKSGSFSYDPNIGFVSSLISILKDDVDYIEIINHHLLKSHLKSKNKLYKNLRIMCKTVHFGFDNEIIRWDIDDKITIPQNYYKLLDEGEKLSMIKFNRHLESKNYEIIFRNIAGCEREKLMVMGVSYTVPKKVQVPDLVYINKKNQIVIVEGECAKNVKKGIIQLSTFNDFINFLLKIENLKFSSVIKGVITDKQVEISDKNYLGYYSSSKNYQLNEIIY